MNNFDTNFSRGNQLQTAEVISHLENGGFAFIGLTELGTFYLYKLENDELRYFSPMMNDWVESSLTVSSLFEFTKFEAIQKEWFDNIPNHGTLCRVWDKFEDDQTIQVVIGYSKFNTFKFKTYNDSYKHAIPLTDAEIDEYFKREK